MQTSILETDRLRLVHPAASHLAAYAAYCASDRSRFVGGPYDAVKAFEKLAAMAGHWSLRGFGRCVLTLRDTGAPIGHVGALQLETGTVPELTWTLWDCACEGRGYAHEAVQAYARHAFAELNFAEMLVRIAPDNVRSRMLAERIGAVRDAKAVPPHWMPGALTYRLKP